MGRPDFDEDAEDGGGGDGSDANLIGYLQESDDGTGLLTASADEDDIYTADGGRSDRDQ